MYPGWFPDRFQGKYDGAERGKPQTMGVPPEIQAASIGIPDTMLLMLLALVVFGPRRLPEIGRQIGKLMYEFRKVSNEFKFQMEEELRASEEAERQKKLEASMAANQAAAATLPATTQVTLDVPPHPVSESAPLELSAGAVDQVAPSVDGEVRAEPVNIQPPSTGEVVAAQKPFRSAPSADTTAASETVTESGAEPAREVDKPVQVADEGRIGTEVQPGVSTEQEAHHG
jgi:sec-independent protein translocase protein TatB